MCLDSVPDNICRRGSGMLSTCHDDGVVLPTVQRWRDRGIMPLGGRLPKPVPVTGRAGDIVLAHYQMAHAVSPNLSGDIRYMCFFRLSVRGLANHRVESMLDIWRDWPKLRPVQRA